LAKTWVLFASSVQSWQEAQSRINGRPPRDCTLEANSTQASSDLCAGFVLDLVVAHYAQEIASQDLLHIAFALDSGDILAKDGRRRKMIQTLSLSPLALKNATSFLFSGYTLAIRPQDITGFGE